MRLVPMLSYSWEVVTSPAPQALQPPSASFSSLHSAMGLLLPGAAHAAPQTPICLLPDPPHRSPAPRSHCRALVVVAGGGRDLDWSPLTIAAAISSAAAGRLVQLLLCDGARGAIAPSRPQPIASAGPWMPCPPSGPVMAWPPTRSAMARSSAHAFGPCHRGSSASRTHPAGIKHSLISLPSAGKGGGQRVEHSPDAAGPRRESSRDKQCSAVDIWGLRIQHPIR